MTNRFRRICAVLAFTLGAPLAAPVPLLAQETVIVDVQGNAQTSSQTGGAVVVDEVTEGIDTRGMVGEDVMVTWAEDGTPSVKVAIPATVFMPIEDGEAQEMHLTLQEELNRLGCDAGTVDGDWGRRSEQAMDRLREAVPDIYEMELSLTLAALMRKMPEGTCPLVCSVREIKVDNACQVKTCPSGQYLDSRGTCRVRQAKAATPKRSFSSSSGGGGGRKCATYNGRTYCN